MKQLLFFIACVGCLLLLSACAPDPIPEQKTYIIEEKKPAAKVFEVDEENPNAWYDESRKDRLAMNSNRSQREYQDEQEEFERRAEMHGVHRTVDGEVIVGYDPDLDSDGLRDVDE